MPKQPGKQVSLPSAPEDAYDAVLSEIYAILESARRAAARSFNAVMTATYWEVGQKIVQQDLQGRKRAGYAEQLIDRLAVDLTRRFGRGFGRRNLFQMRAFYLTYRPIVQTPSAQSNLTTRFPLPWSHYTRLLSIDKPDARKFYETEALRNGWSCRQLDRQISTSFYERSLLSKDKAATLRPVHSGRKDCGRRRVSPPRPFDRAPACFECGAELPQKKP